jgi:ATP:ADP antiporter, AAA family
VNVEAEKRSPLERALSLFAEVRGGEGVTAILLTFNVFLLLLSYYLLKTAREPLILASSGAEVKSYASAGQSILLIGVVKLYAWLGGKLDRVRLITTVNLFFATNLVLFYFLGKLGVPLGIPFFLWVGIFNVSVVAQFWSFAADIYDEEQGKRLFAIVGVGSSVGAVAGAHIAKMLFKPLGPYSMMLIAAGVLALCLLLTRLVHRREIARVKTQEKREEAQKPLGAAGGFELLMRDRYLLLIAALTLLLNWVNTTGEYILDRTLVPLAMEHAAGGGEKAAMDFIGTFKASYFEWVNILGVTMQLFLVSRIFKYLGVRTALFILPAVALLGYSTIAFLPVLSLIFAAKVAENSLDYSVQNTARQALFLVTSREEKYKAKAVIDTFIVRAGDVLSAVTVAVGAVLGLATRHFILVNVGLLLVWLYVVYRLDREHARRSKERLVPGADAPAAAAAP